MKKKRSSHPAVWAFTTYFTEGFPFTLIRTVSSVFFRDMKVSLESIGLTSLFGIPWIIKFLWAPLVDRYLSKRRWLLLFQGLLVLTILLAAAVTPFTFSVRAIALLFFMGSFVAATHDIAIDGYYMEALDKDGQARYVGYRVMAYRIAMMTGTGIVVTLGTTVSWSLAFLAAALIFGAFFVFHLLFLPEVETVKKGLPLFSRKILKPKPVIFTVCAALTILGIRRLIYSGAYLELKEKLPVLKKIYFSHWIAVLLLLGLIFLGIFRRRIRDFILREPDSYYARAFVVFMERDRISLILGFIIFLRSGEWTLSTMVSPFIVDLGIKTHYGWIAAFVGLPASIAGAVLGGWMISRFGLGRVIWPFIMLQNLTNLIYMALASHLEPVLKLAAAPNQPFMGNLNLALVAGVHGFDQFAGGLGTAVLMTYLMRICDTRFKAAHYAIGSGLMNLSGLFAGVLSGFIAGWLGYAWLFGLSFLASVPAMMMIPFLPYLNKAGSPGLSA